MQVRTFIACRDKRRGKRCLVCGDWQRYVPVLHRALMNSNASVNHPPYPEMIPKQKNTPSGAHQAQPFRPRGRALHRRRTCASCSPEGSCRDRGNTAETERRGRMHLYTVIRNSGLVLRSLLQLELTDGDPSNGTARKSARPRTGPCRRLHAVLRVHRVQRGCFVVCFVNARVGRCHKAIL